MLNEQRVSNVFQNCTTTTGGAAVFCQLPRKRLDNIENGAHIPFVMCQNHIRCHRVSDDEHVLRQQRFKRNCSVRRDSVEKQLSKQDAWTVQGQMWTFAPANRDVRSLVRTLGSSLEAMSEAAA